MSPEDIQKEFFRLFNESMKNNVFDKTNVTNKDMDEFFRLNMLSLMDPTNAGVPQIFGPYKTALKDTAKMQMRFCIETMKVQIGLLEKLLGDKQD